VRDRGLLPWCVLPERPAAGSLARRLEQRVVAEAAAPARFEGDPAPGCASARRDQQPARRRRILEGEREDAHVARGPALERDARELAHELLVVVRVGRVRTGIAPRSDARAAIEGVDLEPRIVGEGRQAGRPRGEAGLDPGVGLEGEPVLDGLSRDPELVERDESRGTKPEQVPQLAQLVLGACRDDDPSRRWVGRRFAQRRTGASTTDCASNRLARPSLARSRRASMRARSNGTPSAVPWTSTYVPASVATTLKSTSACESSA